MLTTMSQAEITVVLADDHAVVRKGLRLLLDAEPGLHVLAEAGTVPDALRMACAHDPPCWCSTSTCPAVRASRRSRCSARDAEQTAIVVLTMQNDPSFARQALQAGALGFVLKEAADDELLGAIRLAAEGETYLNPRLGARLAAQPAEPTGPPDDLSEREVEVLQADRARPHQRRDRATAVPQRAHRRDRTARTSSRRRGSPRAPSSCATRSSTGSSIRARRRRRASSARCARRRGRRQAQRDRTVRASSVRRALGRR